MAKQLPPEINIDIYRGCTWPIEFDHAVNSADVVDAQIGFNRGDSVVKVTMDAQPTQWDIQADTGTITLLPGQTQGVEAKSLPYDIKLELNDGTVEAVQRGIITITEDISGAFD